jgi:hypothetical protein
VTVGALPPGSREKKLFSGGAKCKKLHFALFAKM